MSAHTVSKTVYFRVLAALMALLVVTVAAYFVDLGPFNAVAALAVAGLKAALVVLFFMHLRYAGNLARLFAAAGLLWLLILLTLTLSDVHTRAWLFSAAR